MKFEYDHKTGTMMPKNNPQIYFNRSMSGGLRVDDDINKMKYIIERNGDIKFISGNKREVNIYDQRNAHIIADRVKRMFGPEHKYTNYKLFLKGYHMIESYEDFCKSNFKNLNEGLWSPGLERAQSGEVRKEDGIKVISPVGKILLGDMGCGLPYKLNPDDDQYWYYLEDYDMYIFGYDDDDTYTYFKYDEDNDDEDSYHLTQLATSDYDMTDDDFILIKAMLDIDNTYVGMNFKKQSRSKYYCDMDEYRDEYEIYTSYTDARNDAIDSVLNTIEDYIDDDSIDRWRGSFGDDFIDTDALDEFRREDYQSYADDIESESGKHGNRLYDEMMEDGIIEDTDEYFERISDNTEDEDEDESELDYDSPLFDIDDMKEKFVDKRCESYDDVVQWWIDNFGSDGLKNYVDKDRLAELIVDADGVGNTLASYDGDEVEYSDGDETVYIYKTNG